MRIPTLGRIGIAFIFAGGGLLFYAVYWLPAHPLVAFNKPVSLSPGNITTGEFEVAIDHLYYIEIETDWTAKTFPPGCDWHSVLRTQWTLSYDSEVYQPERGSSPYDTSSLALTGFLSETSRYSFDATILPGADCLNAGHPRLLIQTHPQHADSYIYMIWFSVWSVAIGFASLAIVGFHARRKANRPPRMLPEMILRNILPWQRHPPMPLIKGLPDFGLVLGYLFFIFMFIFMIVHRVTPTGLFVHLRQQNAAAWQKGAWPETLGVYVDGRDRFFVNGQLIRKDELATKLNEELSKRMVWTVYFEADEASNFDDTAYSIDTIQGLGAKVFWITPQVRKEFNDVQRAPLPHR